MKKLGLLLLVVLLGTTMAMAQDKGGRGNFDPEEMAKKQSEQLKKELKLNDDQVKKVYDITLKTSDEMMKLREESGDDRDAMRAKMKTIRENNTTEMKEILTEKQYKDYEKYMQERRSGRSGGQRGGGGQR